MSVSCIYFVCATPQVSPSKSQYYYCLKATLWQIPLQNYSFFFIKSRCIIKRRSLHAILGNKRRNELHKLHFFVSIICLIDKIFTPLHYQNPPSLSTMLKCAGRFFIHITHGNNTHSIHRTLQECT